MWDFFCTSFIIHSQSAHYYSLINACCTFPKCWNCLNKCERKKKEKKDEEEEEGGRAGPQSYSPAGKLHARRAAYRRCKKMTRYFISEPHLWGGFGELFQRRDVGEINILKLLFAVSRCKVLTQTNAGRKDNFTKTHWILNVDSKWNAPSPGPVFSSASSSFLAVEGWDPKRQQIVPTCFPAAQLSRGVKPAWKNEVPPYCATQLLCA